MSLGEMQSCLASLYVNEPFRTLFHADPSAALSGYRLTPTEAGAIAGIDRGELDRFAESLLAKRRKKVERAYPLLFAMDKAEICRYFSRFYQLYPAKPHEPWHNDALHFGLYMEESLANAGHLPPYASELAMYERLHYSAKLALATASGEAVDNGGSGQRAAIDDGDTRPRLAADVTVADFNYDFSTAGASLESGQPPDLASIQRGNSSIVFRPAADPEGIHLLRINPPTRTVLSFCDGSHTVSGVVAETESALGAPGNGDGIVAAINHLLSLRVLTLEPQPVIETSFRYGVEMSASQVESLGGVR